MSDVAVTIGAGDITIGYDAKRRRLTVVTAADVVVDHTPIAAIINPGEYGKTECQPTNPIVTDGSSDESDDEVTVEGHVLCVAPSRLLWFYRSVELPNGPMATSPTGRGRFRGEALTTDLVAGPPVCCVPWDLPPTVVPVVIDYAGRAWSTLTVRDLAAVAATVHFLGGAGYTPQLSPFVADVHPGHANRYAAAYRAADSATRAKLDAAGSALYTPVHSDWWGSKSSTRLAELAARVALVAAIAGK